MHILAPDLRFAFTVPLVRLTCGARSETKLHYFVKSP